MKPFFFLLCALYLMTMYISLTVLGHGMDIPPVRTVKSLADVVLLSLCLVGCYGRAFHKIIWTPKIWNAVYTATLILGGFSVVLFGFGEMFGVPSPGGRPSVMTMFMIFLPYALFAVPVIVYEYDMKKGERGVTAES